MAAQSSPTRPRTSSFRRHLSYGQQDLRVSDAERSEVADKLAEHYGEGRLDEAEFNERVDQAMRAKTRSDLAGLFDDLPDGEPPEPITAARPRRRRTHHPLLLIALVIAVAIAAGHVLAWFAFWSSLPVILVALAVLYLVREHQHRG